MGVRGMLGRLARLYETDRRQAVRVPASFSATISGAATQCDAQGIDLHKTGMKVRCDMPLQIGAQVFVRLRALGLVGFASVRHCTPQEDGTYIAGLCLREPLTRERGPSL